MKYKYQCFILHAAPYLPDERRAAMKVWLNGLGEQGWEVFALLPMRESEAGVIAWARMADWDGVSSAFDAAFKKADEAFAEADKAFKAGKSSSLFARFFR